MQEPQKLEDHDVELTIDVLRELTELGNRLRDIESEKVGIVKRTRELLGWSKKV
jgi:hypothetical protein